MKVKEFGSDPRLGVHHRAVRRGAGSHQVGVVGARGSPKRTRPPSDEHGVLRGFGGGHGVDPAPWTSGTTTTPRAAAAAIHVSCMPARPTLLAACRPLLARRSRRLGLGTARGVVEGIAASIQCPTASGWTWGSAVRMASAMSSRVRTGSTKMTCSSGRVTHVEPVFNRTTSRCNLGGGDGQGGAGEPYFRDRRYA